ncbi:MAG: hypothetical protein ACI4WU_02805, partial [Bacilli bacterium]
IEIRNKLVVLYNQIFPYRKIDDLQDITKIDVDTCMKKLLEKSKMITISSDIVRDEIKEMKYLVDKRKKIILKSSRNALWYLLVGSMLITGGIKIADEAKELSKGEKYRTDTDKYYDSDGSYKHTSSYEDKMANQMVILEYYPWEVEDEDNGILKVRSYNVNGMEYDYVVNNIQKIIDEMQGEYIEEEKKVPINGTYARRFSLDKVYEVVRIVQDRNDLITYNDNYKRDLISAIFIFIELLLYAKFIDLNEELIIVSLWNNIMKIIKNGKDNKRDLELIDIYEKVYFDLYRNDREFRSLIDEIKDEYGDLINSKKQLKVRRKEK